MNIDDKLAETDGWYQFNGIWCKAQPYILVGCDLIRTFENVMLTKDKVVTTRFNMDYYFTDVECKRGSSLFLFEERTI